jgi:peptidoglycan/LPS O-acetylase OafA/YrhL
MKCKVGRRRKKGKYFPAIDGLRGVAAAAVVILHFNALFQNGINIQYAHLAVDFFLLLSGFVVSHSYDDKIGGGWSVARFMAVRAARLYPMIIAGSLLGSIIIFSRVVIFKDLSLFGAILATMANLFMFPTRQLLHIRPWGFPLNSPFWSLSVEFIINVIYCAAFRYLKLPVIALLVALGVGVSIWTASLRHTLDVGPLYAEYGLGLARALYPFSMGVLICRLSTRIPSPRVDLVPLALLLIGALLLPISRDWRVELVLTVVVFPAIVVASIHAVARGRVAAFSRWLGKLSFPMYATHYPIVVIFSQGVRVLHLSGLSSHIVEILCGLVVIGVAVVLAVWVEEPGVLVLRRWSARFLPSLRSGNAA